MTTNIRFEDWETEQMQDPEFRKAAEKLEPAYQVAQLRMLRGLTQKQLAKLVGTRQPSIARLESGKREPRLSFLRKVAKALGARLEIRLVPEEEDAHVDHQSNTLELPTNIAADQFATSIASKKQLLAAGRASLESQTPTLLCDGVEIGLASSGEPTPSFTEEAVPMPNWPVRGGIRWIDHAPEEPEAKEALR